MDHAKISQRPAIGLNEDFSNRNDAEMLAGVLRAAIKDCLDLEVRVIEDQPTVGRFGVFIVSRNEDEDDGAR